MKLDISIDHEVYWLTLWSIVVTGVVLIATLIHIGASDEDLMIADLIREGHDPIELACIYKVTDRMAAPCFLIAQNKIRISNAAIAAKK